MTTDSPAPSAGELVTRKDLDITEEISSAGFVPKTMADFKALCNWIWKSKFAPKGFDTPEQVFIACQTAMEARMPIMAGLRCQYVINGKPCWNGQGALALIRSQGRCKLMPRLRWEGDDDNHRAIWRFQREDDHEPIEVEYSVADAKRAGLWMKKSRTGESTPWMTNPDDMLAWRAVSRMGKYYFSDTLLGLDIAESVRDYPRDAIDRNPHAGSGRPAEVATGTVDPLLPDKTPETVAEAAGLKVVDGEVVPAKSDPLIPDEPAHEALRRKKGEELDQSMGKALDETMKEVIRKEADAEMQRELAATRESNADPQQELLPPAEPKDPRAVFIGKGEAISARQATTLRGMARNRCIELKRDGSDAWQTLLFDALGCGDPEVTDDLYEAAKKKIKLYEMPAA